MNPVLCGIKSLQMEASAGNQKSAGVLSNTLQCRRHPPAADGLGIHEAAAAAAEIPGDLAAALSNILRLQSGIQGRGYTGAQHDMLMTLTESQVISRDVPGNGGNISRLIHVFHLGLGTAFVPSGVSITS